jgi:hypothetical protein
MLCTDAQYTIQENWEGARQVMLETAYSDRPLPVEDRQCILAVAKLAHIATTTARKGQYCAYCLLSMLVNGHHCRLELCRAVVMLDSSTSTLNTVHGLRSAHSSVKR